MIGHKTRWKSHGLRKGDRGGREVSASVSLSVGNHLVTKNGRRKEQSFFTNNLDMLKLGRVHIVCALPSMPTFLPSPSFLLHRPFIFHLPHLPHLLTFHAFLPSTPSSPSLPFILSSSLPFFPSFPHLPSFLHLRSFFTYLPTPSLPSTPTFLPSPPSIITFRPTFPFLTFLTFPCLPHLPYLGTMPCVSKTRAQTEGWPCFKDELALQSSP